MPGAEHLPVNALLPAAAGERGGTGADEGHRQAVHQVSVLWQPPDCVVAGAGWDQGGTPPCAPPDAPDGPSGRLSQAEDQPATSGPSGLPLPAQGPGDHASQPGLVRRHHLRARQPRLPLSCGNHGLGDAQGAELAGIEQRAFVRHWSEDNGERMRTSVWTR